MLDNPLTQPVRITDEEMKVFDEVDDIIGKAVLIGDPLMAFEYGSMLRRQQAVRGLALAKLLYRMRESWDLFKAAGTSDDLPTMAQIHLGVAPETTKKYVNMWESVFANNEIGDDIKKILMGRPIGDLLLLTAAAREGSLDDSRLLEAALAPDRSSLRDIIRDGRGEQTSSGSAIRILLYMVNTKAGNIGSLIALRGKERVQIGVLFVESDDDLTKKAIESLLNARHIQEVYGN